MAEINPASRVMQTLGNAAASAGTHGRDGTLNGEDYSAAVDLRTRDLSAAQIRKLLDCLARNGFAAWYRYEGSFTNNRHIHAIYCGLPMKASLKRQVRDFVNDRNGLASHATEKFYTAPKATDMAILALYFHANPGEAKAVTK
jgi:hypothetical protein